MDQNLIILISETLAVTIIGSLLHFTYDWSGHNKFVAVFAAVNESTWEHIKLALSGLFVCTLVDLWFLGNNPNYWLARSLSFLTPIIVIPILFYGYRAIFKVKSCLPADISIFIVAAFLSTLVFITFLNTSSISGFNEIISILTSIIIIAAYLLLTRFPIHHNFLFQDPITHTYGIPKTSSHTKKYARKNKKH